MKKSRLITYILVLTLIGIGIFLRAYEFEGFVTFLSDQGRDAIIVKKIVTLEHFPAIGAPSSVGQVYLGPFYYYLIAPFLLLSNFNPIGLAYGSFIYSFIGMLTVYWVIKKESGILMAFATLFMMVFSITFISFARFSWNPNLLPYFGFFTLYFFYKWLSNKGLWYGLTFGSFFGLTIQLHYLAIFLGIPILIFYIWSLYTTKGINDHIIKLIPALGGFLLFISPLILFDLRNNFLNAKQFINLLTQGKLSSRQPYVARLMDTISGFMTYGVQFETSYIIAFSVLVTILAVGIWYTYKSKSLFISIHIVNIISYIIGFAYLGNPRYAHYYGPIYISLFFIISFILASQKNTNIRNISFALIIIVFLALNIPRYYFLYQEPNNQIQHARTVAMELKKHIQNKPYNIATWPVDMGEDMYTYFLEVENRGPADRAKLEITDQMFVLCSQEPCAIIDSPSWNISMFGPARINNSWKVENITIYKLEHLPTDSL